MTTAHNILIFIVGEGGETFVERKYALTSDGHAPQGLTEAVDDMIRSVKIAPSAL